MEKIYIVISNGAAVGAYTTEEKAKEIVKLEKMAVEMGGGYPNIHYEEVNIEE